MAQRPIGTSLCTSTPTSASGLNLVERLSAESTDKAIRRGVCKHVRALQAVIESYLAVPKADPHPSTWMAYGAATVERILARVGRGQRTRNAIKDSSVPVNERPLPDGRLYAADGITANLMWDEPSGRPDTHGSSIKGCALFLGEA